jgi:hypothetical protein
MTTTIMRITADVIGKGIDQEPLGDVMSINFEYYFFEIPLGHRSGLAFASLR